MSDFYQDIRSIDPRMAVVPVNRDGNVVAVAVMNGQYPGTHPHQMTVDWFDANHPANTGACIAYALNGDTSTT